MNLIKVLCYEQVSDKPCTAIMAKFLVFTMKKPLFSSITSASGAIPWFPGVNIWSAILLLSQPHSGRFSRSSARNSPIWTQPFFASYHGLLFMQPKSCTHVCMSWKRHVDSFDQQVVVVSQRSYHFLSKHTTSNILRDLMQMSKGLIRRWSQIVILRGPIPGIIAEGRQA